MKPNLKERPVAAVQGDIQGPAEAEDGGQGGEGQGLITGQVGDQVLHRFHSHSEITKTGS